MKDNYNFPEKGIHKYVAEYIQSLPNLTGKIVLDIPCGDGRASYAFMQKGATVRAFDLFPDFMKVDGLEAEYADLLEPLPVASNSVDYIICQEGIEHIPNQLNTLKEFNRVLKKGGTLLITTPNNSHVRARISNFFIESEYWKRMPPTEIDSIWFATQETEKMYFGHYFLLGAQHFQSLLSLAGFAAKQRVQTKVSGTSVLFGIPLYPLFAGMSLLTYGIYRKKNTQVEQKKRDHLFWQRVKLNLSPKTLFCKHIFWEMRKKEELSEVIQNLKNMQRKE